MNKTYKILIGLTAFAGLYFIGRHLYRKSKIADDLTLDITNLNNENKSFDYEVKKNGELLTSGKFDIKQPSFGFVDGKNKLIVTNNKSSVELVGKSVDQKKFRQKVKFSDKKGSEGQLEASVKDLLIKPTK
jgi:hypothetical protein